MFCRNCGAEIKNTNFCPNCGAAVNQTRRPIQRSNATANRQQMPIRQENASASAKGKKPIFKRWWFWAIIVFLIIGLASPNSDRSSPATEEEVGNVKTLSFNDTTDVTVRVGETVEDGYSHYVKYTANRRKTVSTEDVEFVSENPEIATINLTKDSYSRLYYEITGISAGETYVYARSTDGSVVSEKVKVSVPVPILVESIELTAENTELAVGQTISPTVIILPENADDKTIIWKSSDESVATVNEDGSIIALGGGTTIVSASSLNGVSSSVEITVDENKHLMKVRVTHPRDDDNNIGDDWSYNVEINGERPTSTVVLSPNEKMTCWARFSEEDNNPDVGEASKTYTVTEEDLLNGFTLSMDLYVKENGGKNSGKAAHFVVTFEFTPIS